jgi:FAD/FMN-containing dehydrogenase
VDRAALGRLRQSVEGAVLAPGDPGYDASRRVWNRMVDARPAAVVRCATEDDVRRSLEFARRWDLQVAVRGGGHSVAGLSTIDGGLVVHLSGLRDVSTDAAARTAGVAGGTTWGEVDRETQAFGLATTGGVISTTGVGGLTLGGGIGHLMRAFGLSCDNVLSYRLITADSRVIHVDRETEPELDWALRGGGGNFGVVTEFTFRLHPLGPRVMAGMIVHGLDRGRDVLRAYRDLAAAAPDELSIQLLLSKAGGREACAFLVCHAGPLDRARRDVQPVVSFGRPVLDSVRPTEYEAFQSESNPTSPPGKLNYWKSHFLTGLDDDAIDALLEAFRRKPVPAGGGPQGGMVIEHLQGAVGRVGAEDTAFPHRRPPFSLELVSVWDDEAESAAHVGWTREAWAAMVPWSTGGAYVNYLPAGDERPVDASPEATFGPANLDRLARVKAAWDPDNVFRRNQNVDPAPPA